MRLTLRRRNRRGNKERSATPTETPSEGAGFRHAAEQRMEWRRMFDERSPNETSTFSPRRNRSRDGDSPVLWTGAGEMRILPRLRDPKGKRRTINKDKSREIGEAFMALAKDATRGIAGGGRM